MTTTDKAASNGKAPADKPERINGVARVQEAQAYHLISVAHDAVYEAERLCNEIYRAASDAYLRDTGASNAADVLTDPAMAGKAEEAVLCLATAVLYLTDLFCGSQPD